MSNVDDKITQCKNDIAKLQENLKALEAEKNKYVPRHGDYGYDSRSGTNRFQMWVRNTQRNVWTFVFTDHLATQDKFVDERPGDREGFVLIGNVIDDFNKRM